MSNTPKSILSINDFNATKQSENGFEFEFINEHGQDTGFFITVIGEQAESVKKAMYAKLNKERQQAELLKRRGKEAPIKTFEELVSENVETISSCIIGWRGIAEEYTPELALSLCENNKLIYDQVKTASETLSNFTKSK